MKLIRKSMVLVTASIFSMGLLACGDAAKSDKKEEEDKEEEEENAGGSGGTVASGGVVGAGAGNTATFSLVGSWLNEQCDIISSTMNLQDDGGTGDTGDGGDTGDTGEGDVSGDGSGADAEEGMRELYVFNADGTMQVSFDMLHGVGCVDKMLSMSFDAKYMLGAEISADPAVHALDIELTAGTITIHNQDFVDALNSSAALTQDDGSGDGDAAEGDGTGDGDGSGGKGFCTKDTPWEVGVPADISTMECDEDMPAVGTKIYEIVSVSGDLMHMSDTDQRDETTGETPETRPTVIETDEKYAYKKQPL